MTKNDNSKKCCQLKLLTSSNLNHVALLCSLTSHINPVYYDTYLQTDPNTVRIQKEQEFYEIFDKPMFHVRIFIINKSSVSLFLKNINNYNNFRLNFFTLSSLLASYFVNLTRIKSFSGNEK